MKYLKQLWGYLLDPTPEQESSNFSTKLTRFIFVLGLNVATVTIVLAIQYIFKYLGLIDVEILPVFNKSNYTEQLTLLLSTIFIIPIIEEFIFRLHLLTKKQNIRISIITFIVYLTSQLVYTSKSTFAISMISSLGVVLLIGYIVFQKRINDGIKEVWKNKFRSVFYITALVFGGIHIINHKLSLNNLIFAPLIFAPQIILGLNAGYLRIKSGFKWGLLLHIAHNVVFVGIFLYLMNPNLFDLNKNAFIIDYPPTYSSSNDYSLTIDEGKESAFNTYKITPDEISFKDTKMKEVFARLANANQAKIIFESKVIENKIINLRFINKSRKKSKLRNTRYFIIEELFKKYNIEAKLYIVPEGYWLLTQRDNSNYSLPKTLILGNKEENMELITIKNGTIKELMDNIETLYSINCVAVLDNRNKYNFRIPKNNIVALQKILSIKYDFEFQKMKARTDYFYISSRND